MTSRDDRVEGVLLATAAGDALGAPYEFQPARGPELEVAMVGGGGWEPGEWTDDTSMAIAIAEVAATGADLRDEAAQDAIVARWRGWIPDAKDVGIQTRSVLTAAGRDGISAARARAEAAKLHQRTGRTAGNGSLMRTAPVALAYLDDGDEDAMVAAARALSELTHFDPEAGDACVLWCCAIRHAVRTGELDVRIGLRHIESSRRDLWSTAPGRGGVLAPGRLRQQRLGGRRAAGRLVGHRHHARPGRRPGVRGVPRRPSPPRPGCRGARRRRHRHRRGDRRRPARRRLRRLRGPAGMAPPAARLAGHRRARVWSRSPAPSNARENRTPSTSPIPVRRSTRSPATPTTTACGSAASARCGSCPRTSTRSSRCAGSADRGHPPATSRTSRSG